MELGNTSNVRWFSGIGEYVIDWGPGYLNYLAKDSELLIVLFGGGTKRRQQAGCRLVVPVSGSRCQSGRCQSVSLLRLLHWLSQ